MLALNAPFPCLRLLSTRDCRPANFIDVSKRMGLDGWKLLPCSWEVHMIGGRGRESAIFRPVCSRKLKERRVRERRHHFSLSLFFDKFIHVLVGCSILNPTGSLIALQFLSGSLLKILFPSTRLVGLSCDSLRLARAVRLTTHT